MGYRGQVRTVNKIEYGSSLGGHVYDQLVTFLNEGEELCSGFYPPQYSDETWEFYKETMKNLIAILQNIDDEIKERLGAIMNSENDYESNQEGFDDALDCLITWLEESDPNDDFVTIDWF